VATRLSPITESTTYEEGLEVYQFDGAEAICLDGLEIVGQDHKQVQNHDEKEAYHQDEKSSYADVEKGVAGATNLSSLQKGGIFGFSKRSIVAFGIIPLLLIAASFHFLFIFLTRAFN
jgi:hypothetical protein